MAGGILQKFTSERGEERVMEVCELFIVNWTTLFCQGRL